MNPKDLVPGQRYYLKYEGIITYVEPWLYGGYGGYLFQFHNLEDKVVLGKYDLPHLRPLTKLDHLLAGEDNDGQ
jgi:hypothetical protein